MSTTAARILFHFKTSRTPSEQQENGSVCEGGVGIPETSLPWRFEMHSPCSRPAIATEVRNLLAHNSWALVYVMAQRKKKPLNLFDLYC